MTWLTVMDICVTNDHGHVPLVVSTSRGLFHIHDLSPCLEPLVFSGVRVTRSLVLCVCFEDRCLSFCPFSFGYCVVCFLRCTILITPLVSSNSSCILSGGRPLQKKIIIMVLSTFTL